MHWTQVKFILFSFNKTEVSQNDGILGNEGLIHKEVEQMVFLEQKLISVNPR